MLPAMYPDALQSLARAYSAHTGVSPHRLGVIVGVGGKFFKLLAAGKGFHSSNGEKAVLWFAENWPDELPWPRWIYRPPTGAPPANRPDAESAGEAA